MDNSTSRLIDVFFYGLYMDAEILKSKNVVPRNKRHALVYEYKLKVGNMATLLREEDAKAYGILYALTHDEIHCLYEGSGIAAYVAEPLMVETEEGEFIPAITCILKKPPADEEFNREYWDKLMTCMTNYNLPLPEKQKTWEL